MAVKFVNNLYDEMLPVSAAACDVISHLAHVRVCASCVRIYVCRFGAHDTLLSVTR